MNAADRKRWTAVHHAARAGHPGILRELIKHGADVNRLTKRRMTPLMVACKYGDNSAPCAEELCQVGP